MTNNASVEAVILAAGLSSRAGEFKMNFALGDKTLIQLCIEPFYELCTRIYVVGGFQIEKLKKSLRPYDKVELLYNRDYESGMFSSVKFGIRSIQAERFFLTPGDHPFIQRNTLLKMLSTEGSVIIPTVVRKKGHPILLSGSLAEEILHADNSSNLREFLSRKEITYLPIEPQNEKSILFDIDTYEDYVNALDQISPKA